MKVFSGLGVQELIISFKGSTQPVVYYIEDKSKVKSKEEKLRASWLGK